MDFDFNNKTTLGKIKLVMLKGEKGSTGHGALVANSVAEMTDKTQIYVYTGATTADYTFGDWCYWDGSEWVDGGAYNSPVVTSDNTEIESANFALTDLSYNDDGYLTLISDTGNPTHQNYAYCKSNLNSITRFRFRAQVSSHYSLVRPFIDTGFHKITFVMQRSDGTCRAYIDETFETSVRATEVFSTNPLTDGSHVFDLVIIGTTVIISVDGVFCYKIELPQYIAGAIVKVGYNYRGYGTSSSQSAYKGAEMFSRQRFAHISFDDQLDCLEDLTTNSGSYTSIFDSPYFSVLKTAHDNFGAKFTLELYYQNDATSPTFDLTDVTADFKQEFIDNSGWIKFAYHGPDPDTKPADDMTTESLVASVADAYAQITRFAGRSCIDTTPRLSFFNCTKAQALALKSGGYITGFLTADNVRPVNTGLTAAEKAVADACDVYTDFANGISYFRSSQRFDNGEAPTTVAAIDHILADEASRQNDTIYIIFAHTYTSDAMQGKLNALCAWCNSRSLPFGYPFEHIEY